MKAKRKKCKHEDFDWIIRKAESTVIKDVGEDMDGVVIPIVCADCGAKGEETYLFNERTWDE